MPGINSRGVPYPLDSDPIADWPQILADLAGVLRAMTRGVVSLSDGGAQPASEIVTFPAGMFSHVPGVFVSSVTGAGDSTISNLWVTGITVDQATISLSRSTTTVVYAHWFAIG